MKRHKKYSYLVQWICDVQRFEILKINSVNPLYLIINKMNRYFKEIEENTYLTLLPDTQTK